MEKQKKILIEQARNEHTNIFPCGDKALHECFTVHKNNLLFWFNTEDHNTHVLIDEVNELRKN